MLDRASQDWWGEPSLHQLLPLQAPGQEVTASPQSSAGRGAQTAGVWVPLAGPCSVSCGQGEAPGPQLPPPLQYPRRTVDYMLAWGWPFYVLKVP